MYLATETLTSLCPNEFSFPLDVNQGASESTLETLPKVYIQNVLSLKAFCKFQFSHPFLKDGLRSYIYSLKIYWSRCYPKNSFRLTVIWPVRFSHPDGKVLPEHLSIKLFFPLPLTNPYPNNSSSSYQVTPCLYLLTPFLPLSSCICNSSIFLLGSLVPQQFLLNTLCLPQSLYLIVPTLVAST